MRGSRRIAAWLAAALAVGGVVAAAAGEPIPPPRNSKHGAPSSATFASFPGTSSTPASPARTAGCIAREQAPHRNEALRDPGQLLFKTGDPYRRRLVEETERILRSKNYLYEASIVPVAFDGRTVDLEVRTRDVWTLNPGLNFNRKGGNQHFRAAARGEQLLGTGQQLALKWDDNVDGSPSPCRSSIRISGTASRDSPWLQRCDDGDTKVFGIDRPFYALDTRWSAGTYLSDSLRNDVRYALGENIGEFEHREERYELRGGWSRGLVGGWPSAGPTASRTRATASGSIRWCAGRPLPEDRELLYRGSASSWSRTASRSARTRTRSSAPRTSWSASAPVGDWVSPSRAPDRIATRSS